MNISKTSTKPSYFAETAVGAVLLLALQFLSLPILVGGLALIGLAKLVSTTFRKVSRDAGLEP